MAALKSGDRSASAVLEGGRTRSALVVAEIAVATVLLIGAGLLARSFVSLLQSDLGFATEDRAVLQVFIWDRNPTFAHRVQRARQMVEAMEAVPGVERVALASSLPFFSSGTNAPVPFTLPGRPEPPAGQERRARPNATSSSYFEVLGVPLLEGRPFTKTDRLDAPAVLIVNQSFVESIFPDEDPIGRQVRLTMDNRDREIVGVVGDVRTRALDTPGEPEVYVPFEQSGYGGLIFVARTSVDASSVVKQLQEAVWTVDPGQSIFTVTTLEALVGDTLETRRFSLALLAAFSVTALVLAAVGIFGLISFSTRRRTHEIGIRIAIGAQRGEVARMVLREGVRLGLLGVAVGAVLALVLTRFMAHMLYTVQATDPRTYSVLALLMLLLTVLATYLPARRASRLDPVKALREE